MNRSISVAGFGALGVDTIATIDDTHAAALKRAGISFAVRYLGGVSTQEIDTLHKAGLAVMFVTYGGAFDGKKAVAELERLGVPKGKLPGGPQVTTWLDVEGQDNVPALDLIRKINAWAAEIQLAGYEAGMYVGWASQLTSAELYALKVTRYWHSISKVLDRNGQLAEPACGWCMHQLYPGNRFLGGVQVDVNVVQQDYRGRLPSWCVGTP